MWPETSDFVPAFLHRKFSSGKIFGFRAEKPATESAGYDTIYERIFPALTQ